MLGSATALALGGAELLTRLFTHEQAILFPRYHTGADYGPYHLRRLRPRTTFRHTSADGSWLFTTNAQGFRDARDWSYARTPGVGRVLVLGDSHTQGFECRQDHTYSAVLEQQLRARGRPTEVLNCGISGFGTAEELAFLENEGFKYHPDVVALGFVGNDFGDNVKSELFAMRDQQLITQGFTHQPGVAVLDWLNRWAALRWLSEHSYFYSLLFNRVWDWSKTWYFWKVSTAKPEFVGASPTPDKTTADYQSLLATKLIERMGASCRQHGARFLIAEIPYYEPEPGFVPSMSADQALAFRAHCEALLTHQDWLGAERDVLKVFVHHGYHHISETSHLLLGLALAEKVAAPR